MLSTLIALPYEIARLPVVVIDNTLSDRMTETSGPRVTLDRVIGSADQLAGALLRNRDIAARGTDRLERSEKLIAAARLEQQAADSRDQARATAAAGRRSGTQKRKAAQERAASGLAEAAAAEARGKDVAAKQAAKAAAAKKSNANQRAASRTATAEKRKGRVNASAEAKKASAQQKAGEKLKDVRMTRQSAAEARADAERLSELTAVKKQERKQS